MALVTSLASARVGIGLTIIDEEGNVTQVRVLKGLPEGLAESAVATVQTWRFKPATLKGQPVPA